MTILSQVVPSVGEPGAPSSATAGGRPLGVRVGDLVYVGAQVLSTAQHGSTDADDIESQTQAVFEQLTHALHSAGAGMADLIKLHTYYQCPGDGPQVTQFWERMTGVRLRHMADPGPAGTAVRVLGAPTRDRLIGVDGIAVVGIDKQRIMPDHAWDWSIPTPLSQGWRVGDTVFVGGQISADRQGRAVAPDDAVAQTRNTLEYIRHVLAEAGAGWEHLVAMRICFKHSGSPREARELLATILDEIRAVVPEPRPVLTAFGVDLLYEGLVLEIDAVAVLGGKTVVEPAGSVGWVRPEGFPTACRVGPNLHWGAIGAPGAASLEAQAEATLERVKLTLAASGFDIADIAKVTAFFVADDDDPSFESGRRAVTAILEAYLPAPGPVVTVVAVPGLPHEGQRFSIDGLAVRADSSNKPAPGGA